MEEGYIKLNRKFFKNKIWQTDRAFSEGEAWLDLIQLARFDTSEISSRIGVHEVTWGRGQYPASNRFLMKKWGRSEQWVRTFLSKLKKDKMISVDSSQGINVITLLNYDRYNGDYSAENSLNNAPNNSLNQLDLSKLQELITQQVTQQITQWSLTSNANKKKDKERKESNNNPPYNPPVDSSEDFSSVLSLSELRKIISTDDQWKDAIGMRYKIDIQSVNTWIETFFQHLNCSGETLKSLKDFKHHFTSWLSIQLSKNQNNGNYKRKPNTTESDFD